MLKTGKKILENKLVKLCFFGDSITEGCFEFNDDFSDTTFKRELGYPYKLQALIKKELNKDVIIINAGKSGNNTVKAMKRFEPEVLAKKPDFCLIMFGSNDVVNIAWKQMDEDTYFTNLKYYFDTLKQNKIEVVFMTPSMMATRDKGTLVNTKYQETLVDCVRLQNDGTVDRFFEKVKEFCHKENVPVVDVYSKWKALEKDGVDIMDLLSNDVNHPTEEMHWLFAQEIYKLLFEAE